MQELKVIAYRDFMGLKVEAMRKAIPCVLEMEGAPVAVIGNIEDFIYIGDLHPRVRKSFKAQEEKVRKGMPKLEKVTRESANKEIALDNPEVVVKQTTGS